MCWKATGGIAVAAKTAEEDIPVFKVVYAGCRELKCELRSYYRNNFYWELGKSAGGLTLPEKAAVVEEGYHSYSPECQCIVGKRGDANYAFKELPVWREDDGQGMFESSGVFESPYFIPTVHVNRIRRTAVCPKGEADTMLDSYPAIFSRCDIAVLECVIPAGARYFANNNGEYVSETLMPVRVAWRVSPAGWMKGRFPEENGGE